MLALRKLANIKGTACQLECVTDEGLTHRINETGHEPSVHKGAPYDFHSDK
jgi:hypothetical protein